MPLYLVIPQTATDLIFALDGIKINKWWQIRFWETECSHSSIHITGLTFSLSVAFMKLFIQNETLSFTPTTRDNTENRAFSLKPGLHSTRATCRWRGWPAGLSVTSSMVTSTALLTRMPDSETESLLSAGVRKGLHKNKGQQNVKSLNYT